MAISPSAVTAILDADPAGPQHDGDFKVRLRALALDPAAAARSGVVAWEMFLTVDCVSDRVRAGPTTGFSDRRAAGEGAPIAPADRDWRRPQPGTQLDSILRASCDPRFVRPLSGLGATTALALPAPPAGGAPVPLPPRPHAPAATDMTAARSAVGQAPVALASARPASGVRLQVMSSPVESETRRRLERLTTKLGPAMGRLTTQVQPAKVGGRDVYRGMISGFANRADARAFCGTLRSAGQDCLLK